jgi:adenosylhomocysteine nucleosidase
VVLALSRIGKVAAATTATTLIEAFGVHRVVFTGVAGGLQPEVRVGDLIVADAFVQHDMNATPLFPRFEVPLYRRARFPCDDALRDRLLASARHAFAASGAPWAGARVHQGLIASGDSFLAAAADARALRTNLHQAGHHALAVEMEGAAVAQVCHDYGVPYVAMRTISDNADEQAAGHFMDFVERVAGPCACAVILDLLRRL